MNTQISLSGVRIWLSGSVRQEAEPDESERLLAFTKSLAAECFRAGAYLVHGCHSSLMPPLLSAAKEYREKTGRKATLRLVASAAYQEPNGGYAGITEDELHKESEFRAIPISGDKDLSLTRMRDSLASEADVLVAIGGDGGKSPRITPGCQLNSTLRSPEVFQASCLEDSAGQRLDTWRSTQKSSVSCVMV